jgi:hypothetical protein
MTFFKKLRLATQLVSTFILAALISGVVGLVAYWHIHQIDEAGTWLYEKCTVPLGQIANIAGDFNHIRLEVHQIPTAPTKELAKEKNQVVLAMMQDIQVNLQGYAKTLIDAEDEVNYLKLKAMIEAYDREDDKVLELTLAGQGKDALALSEGDLQRRGNEITEFLKKLVEFNEKFARETSRKNTLRAQAADRKMGIAIGLGMLLSILLGLMVTRIIRRQLGGDPAFATEVVQRIAQGDLGARLHLQAGAEASLLGSIGSFASSLERLAAQADAIGRGDFSQDVQPLSEQDRLGHAISNMNNLLRAAKTEDERRNWLKDGSSRLALALTGDFSLQQLADTAVAMTGRYLDAGRGVFYIHRSEEQALDLLGSYMYTERANLGSRFKEGEGAVGQVAREKKPILLTTVAPGSAPIVTGTTSAPPLYTYTYPLLREGALLGVLEFASFERFDDLKLEYLQSATEVIASSLYVAQQRENIRTLLTATENAEREARAMSEHLQEANAQMEEQQQLLQQQTEELQQSNAQMEEQQQLLQQQTEELQQSNAQMEEQQQQLQQQTEELQQTNAQMEEQQQQLEQNNRELRDSKAELDVKAKLLEQSSQYKSEFLANMSHELRTPLNSIILLSKMMATNPEGRLQAEEVKRAEVIHRSGKDLLNLINDVLDLSKVEAGRMDLNLAEISSSTLAEEFMDSFGSTAQDQGLAFVIEDRLQGSFTSDPDKLSQILRNLLSNAFKFTKDGTVTLVFERRTGEALPLVIGVRDTGIGIPVEKQESVFEAFHQADGSTSREFGGTGLGLTISLRLAQLLGGTIQLKSVPGGGSEFDLRLPETPSSLEENRPTDDREHLKAGDQVILLIDDDFRFGEAILDMNRRLGYKTLLAGTGAEGLSLARSHHPAGILLDLGLPDLNGAEVLHALKSTRELASIPVYVVSARDRDEALARQGIVGYLQKPVDDRQIAQAEATLLASAARAVLGGALVVASGGIGAKEVAHLGSELGLSPEQVCQVLPGARLESALEEQPWRLGIIDMTGLSVEAGLAVAASIRKVRANAALVFFGVQALSEEDEARLRRYSDSIIVKAPYADRRLREDMERFLREAPRAGQAPAWAALQGRDKPLTGRSILVVDDDPRNLFVITAALEQNGATVKNAVNGRHALELMELGGVDLVFMDIMMPEMDGYQTIQKVRANPNLARLPIIAVTAKAMFQDREQTLLAGADDYLSKPVEYEILIDKAILWSSAQR